MAIIVINRNCIRRVLKDRQLKERRAHKALSLRREVEDKKKSATTAGISKSMTYMMPATYNP
jgi:hypothetical protein